jgi:hypothetical protein
MLLLQMALLYCKFSSRQVVEKILVICFPKKKCPKSGPGESSSCSFTGGQESKLVFLFLIGFYPLWFRQRDKIRFFFLVLVLREEKLPSWSGVKFPKLWVSTSLTIVLEHRPFFQSFPVGKHRKNTRKVSSDLCGFQNQISTRSPGKKLTAHKREETNVTFLFKRS